METSQELNADAPVVGMGVAEVSSGYDDDTRSVSSSGAVELEPPSHNIHYLEPFRFLLFLFTDIDNRSQ